MMLPSQQPGVTGMLTFTRILRGEQGAKLHEPNFAVQDSRSSLTVHGKTSMNLQQYTAVQMTGTNTASWISRMLMLPDPITPWRHNLSSSSSSFNNFLDVTNVLVHHSHQDLPSLALLKLLINMRALSCHVSTQHTFPPCHVSTQHTLPRCHVSTQHAAHISTLYVSTRHTFLHST